MSSVPEEERFSKNAIIVGQIVNDGISRLYNAGYKTVNPALIGVATAVIASFDKHYLIQGFIKNSHDKCWDEIKTRDEKFFANNASDIFRYLPMDKVNLFKDLYETVDSSGKGVLSQSFKDQIWDLFDAMIKICIKYVHKGRKPYSYVNEHSLIVGAYGAEFFDEVDLNHHIQVWGVKLDFPTNV